MFADYIWFSSALAGKSKQKKFWTGTSLTHLKKKFLKITILLADEYWVCEGLRVKFKLDLRKAD